MQAHLIFAVRTIRGSFYSDSEATTHSEVAERCGVPLEEVIETGWRLRLDGLDWFIGRVAKVEQWITPQLDHASRNENPHVNRMPHSSGSAAYPPPLPATMPKNPLMARLGPALWARLHRWALTANLAMAAAWIEKFTRSIPCGECKERWRKWQSEHPPDYSSPEALFAWTVDAHNTVNARLGTSIISLEEALKIWG